MPEELDPVDGMVSRRALAREVLVFRMKLLSEDLYAAGWISGLEFDVWRMAFEGKPLFGKHPVTDSMAKSFRDLATLSEGWWVHEDKTCPSQPGPVFVSMARWKEILAERDKSP